MNNGHSKHDFDSEYLGTVVLRDFNSEYLGPGVSGSVYSKNDCASEYLGPEILERIFEKIL